MGGKRRPKKHHTEKMWGCLSSLKTYFETSGVEKVVEFNGYDLTTNKGTYGLYDGVLSFEAKETKRTRRKKT